MTTKKKATHNCNIRMFAYIEMLPVSRKKVNRKATNEEKEFYRLNG